jgi:GT2 family glycosyltransferase
MLASIIIPVCNQVAFTKKSIEDLLHLTSDHEVIVVDNGSTDETQSFMSSVLEKRTDNNPVIKYIRLDHNTGFGAANNIGVESSTGENLLFLNNDIRVLKNKTNWLKELIPLCQDKFIAAQSGKLRPDFTFVAENSTPHILEDKLEYLSGWSLLGSRKLFDRIAQDEGVIWSKLYFAYFEDVHLSWRARELGIGMEVVKMPLHHFGRVTSSKLGLSEMYKKSFKIFENYWRSRV